jgi:hypothetical protein
MSGLSQDPLWEEPPWTAAWPVGTKVRSRWTSNTGEVVSVDHLGRHLLVKWDKWLPREPAGFTCRHSSENGLERLP